MVRRPPNGPREALRVAIIVASWALVAGAATTTGASAATAEPAAGRQGFAVQPFTNVKRVGPLQHLTYGLPALIAERFAHLAPLRFMGGPQLFARTPPGSARWLVRGAVERQADQKIAVTVEIWRAAAPGEMVARVTRLGPKDQVDATALQTAAAAFAVVPGLDAPAGVPALAQVAFGRDPYAFTLYGRAVGAFHGGGGGPARAELAIELLRHSLRIDPTVPETRRFIAVALLATEKPALARAMLTYALDVRPDYALALATLANLDRDAGRPSARQHYARLTELDPDDVASRRSYGELLLAAGQLAEAQTQLEAVLAATPEDARARQQLVVVLSSRQQGKQLADQLEQAVERDPENLDMRMDLGAAYLSLAKKREAADAYDEVLRRRPRHSGALKLAAGLAAEGGDLRKAVSYYAKLRTVAPQDPRPVFLLAAAYAQAGALDRAERLFEEGSRFPGMLPEAYSNLGAIALRRGNPRQALWFLSRAAKRRPERVAVRYNHALALHELGKHAEALDEVRAARTADPADAGVHFLEGVLALELGRTEDALLNFKMAVELDPAHTDALENLALLRASRTSPASERSVPEEPVPFDSSERPVSFDSEEPVPFDSEEPMSLDREEPMSLSPSPEEPLDH